MEKERVSLTLDKSIVTEAKQRAEESDRSLSQYVNLVLRDYMHRQDILDKVMVKEQPIYNHNKPYHWV